MANQNSVVYTAYDFNISLSATEKFTNGLPLAISAPKTLDSKSVIIESLDINTNVESEYIHSISSAVPQALKVNGFTYGGKISIELGNLNDFLKSLSANSITELIGATITVVAYGNAYSKKYENVVFTSDSYSVKSKDKRTIASFDFQALSVS